MSCILEMTSQVLLLAWFESKGKGRVPDGSSVFHGATERMISRLGCWWEEIKTSWSRFKFEKLRINVKMSSRWLDLPVMKFRKVQEC